MGYDSGSGKRESVRAAAPRGSAGAELRAAPRFTLLLRCAKLIADGREFICVLRDASETGLKVRLFHPLPPSRTLELELPGRRRHPLELVWQRPFHAGLRFRERVDVQAMLDDRDASRPRRPLRLELERPAEVVVQGAVSLARVVNISQHGACIACEERLSLRERVRIEIDLVRPLQAHVCWRDTGRYGLAFQRPFALDELARSLARLQTPTLAASPSAA